MYFLPDKLYSQLKKKQKASKLTNRSLVVNVNPNQASTCGTVSACYIYS